MLRRDEGVVEAGVDGTMKVWHRMAQLPKHRPSVDVVKQVVVFVGLIRESSIVQEYVLEFLTAFRFRCNADRFSHRWCRQ